VIWCFSTLSYSIEEDEDLFNSVHLLKQQYITSLAIIPDQNLCTVAIDGEEHKNGQKDPDLLMLINLDSGEILHSREISHDPMGQVAVSPDGEILAFIHGNMIEFIQLNSWKVITQKSLLSNHRFPTRAVVFAPSGKAILLSFEDRLLSVQLSGDIDYDISLPQKKRSESYIWDLSLSPDGKTIACARDDGSITIHAVNTGELICTFRDGYHQLYCVAFSPDSKMLLTGDSSCYVTIFDLDTKKKIDNLPKHGDHVRDIVFSPNGNLIATGCSDGYVRIFSVKTKTLLFKQKIGATSLEFKNDKQLIAGGNGLTILSSKNEQK
jgi:WD40 repeat protein